MAPEDTERTALPVCADCGLEITDLQDIEYTLDSEGNVTTTLHTDAFHRELVGCDRFVPVKRGKCGNCGKPVDQHRAGYTWVIQS